MEPQEVIRKLRDLVDDLEYDLEKHPDKPSRIGKDVAAIKDLLEYL